MEWQPIETAPKDETEILAYLVTECGSIRWIGIIYWGIFGVSEQARWLDNYADEVNSIPTHWMPLPDAPK